MEIVTAGQDLFTVLKVERTCKASFLVFRNILRGLGPLDRNRPSLISLGLGDRKMERGLKISTKFF